MLAIFNSKNKELLEIKNYQNKISTKDNEIYINGKIKQIIKKNYELINLKTQDEVLCKIKNFLPYIAGNYFIISVKNDKFDYATSDISAMEEIYYFLDKNYLFISDSISEIAPYINDHHINKEELNFFLNHGYCNCGKTYFTNLYRLPPGRSLIIRNDKFILTNYLNEFKSSIKSYDQFKSVLEHTIKNIGGNSRKNAVLLSGGVDSSVLLGILMNYFDTKVLTLNIEPYMSFNAADIPRSQKICQILDKEQEIINVDFNEIDFDKEIEYLIKNMPFASHISVGFLSLFKSLKYGNNVWCGQNCDNLYNLGATSKLMYINRFLLSDYYLKTLIGIRGAEKYKYIKKIVDWIIKNIYFYLRHEKYNAPTNIYDFIKFFNNSDRYLPLCPENLLNNKMDIISHGNLLNDKIDAINISKALNLIYDEKLGNYITGGDHKVVLKSANYYKSNAILPYSWANMIHLFRNLKKDFNDIIYPKKFLYKYAANELGINKHIFSKNFSNNSYLTIDDWEKYILEKTEFGKKIKESPFKNNSIISSCKTLNQYIATYWVNKNIDNMCIDHSIL